MTEKIPNTFAHKKSASVSAGSTPPVQAHNGLANSKNTTPQSHNDGDKAQGKQKGQANKQAPPQQAAQLKKVPGIVSAVLIPDARRT